jgi:hypothetical protein
MCKDARSHKGWQHEKDGNMSWNDVFRLASGLALAGWIALLLLPRRPWLNQLIRIGVVGVLSVLYSSLIFVYFYRVQGGGFGSIGAVRTLFSSDPLLVAGWVHYLAFDLFIGVWLAERLDGQGLSRFVQAPILMAAFMFGPVGLLLGLAPGLLPGQAQINSTRWSST